jgi:hypothetical protein
MKNRQNKERILKTEREKNQVTYKAKPSRMTAEFSTETLKGSSAWNYVLQTLKENSYQKRFLNPSNLSFIVEGEIKTSMINKS